MPSISGTSVTATLALTALLASRMIEVGIYGNNTLRPCLFARKDSICQYIDGTTRDSSPSCEVATIDGEDVNECRRFFDMFWWKPDAEASIVRICLVFRFREDNGQARELHCLDVPMATSALTRKAIAHRVAEQVQLWRQDYLSNWRVPQFTKAVDGSIFFDPPLPKSWFVGNGYTAGIRRDLH